jgi:uncharacterized protein (TIGR03437 family)
LYWSSGQGDFVVSANADVSSLSSFPEEQRQLNIGGTSTYTPFPVIARTQAPASFQANGFGILTDAVTGRLVDPGHPLVADKPYTMWLTGLGNLAERTVITNSGVSTTWWTPEPPTVVITDACVGKTSVEATVLFAGGGGFIGLNQINFLISSASLQILASVNSWPGGACTLSDLVSIQLDSTRQFSGNSSPVRVPVAWPL